MLPILHKCYWEMPGSAERLKELREKLDRLNEDMLD